MRQAWTPAAGALVAALAMPGAAMADTVVLAMEDTTLRVGPGAAFEAIVDIPLGSRADVHGCAEELDWCEVGFEGHTGWASADDLAIDVAGTPVPIPGAASEVEIPTATFEQ